MPRNIISLNSFKTFYTTITMAVALLCDFYTFIGLTINSPTPYVLLWLVYYIVRGF